MDVRPQATRNQKSLTLVRVLWEAPNEKQLLRHGLGVLPARRPVRGELPSEDECRRSDSNSRSSPTDVRSRTIPDHVIFPFATAHGDASGGPRPRSPCSFAFRCPPLRPAPPATCYRPMSTTRGM